MPSSLLTKLAHLTGALLLATASLQTWAQAEAPGRVARLNHVDGGVSFAPAGSDAWGPVEINRPLTAGDRLQTDPGARAELHSGSTALRLAGQSVLEISELDDDNTRLTLTQGTLALRVRNLYPGERMEINTPNLAFTVSQPGEYRLDVDPNYRTTGVTVRSGSGVVYGENGATRSLSGQQEIRFADRQLAQEVAQNNPPRDSFDMWTVARDRAEDQSLSARYMSRDMTGYEQLDSHGDWRTDTEFGTVWIPRVTVGQWAPYRNGQWRWVAPWGWTWVDDAPWGFAPFHYGRWAQIGPQWVWVPGPVGPRPVYAPALVGFPNDRGNNWHDRQHPPSSGWVPLGPRDPWRPGYRQGVPPPMAMPPIGNPQPNWRNDGPRPMPRPEMRPELRPFDAPMPAPRNLGELEQRNQMQRQQQADRERQQQAQPQQLRDQNRQPALQRDPIPMPRPQMPRAAEQAQQPAPGVPPLIIPPRRTPMIGHRPSDDPNQ
ncbi:DUF6600 domain-containing protein [Rhodoferax sp.]|uniref:DUF6600 domain-containing protein n=1 Tax=Rhodoferax sp. TaxID=50421 RepID=UPI00374D00DA